MESSHSLSELIASVHVKGWKIWVEAGEVRMQMAAQDSRGPGDFDGLHDRFVVPRAWTRDDVLTRLFCNLQYLTDHELREHFTVDGHHPFDPHNPTMTGPQKEWFVEHQSALRGYEA